MQIELAQLHNCNWASLNISIFALVTSRKILIVTNLLYIIFRDVEELPYLFNQVSI